MGRAIKAYTQLCRSYPNGTPWLQAPLTERHSCSSSRTHYMKAATTYRWLVERYPSSPNFDEAIEAQFRVGEMYLSGKKIKLLGIPTADLDWIVRLKSSLRSCGPPLRQIYRPGPVRYRSGPAETACK